MTPVATQKKTGRHLNLADSILCVTERRSGVFFLKETKGINLTNTSV